MIIISLFKRLMSSEGSTARVGEVRKITELEGRLGAKIPLGYP
jgi:hypothetical protein